MAEVSLELLQTMIQRVLDRQADQAALLSEVGERLGSLEGQYASMSRRLDRVGDDVERIKRRLDLVDQPTA